MLNEKRSPRVYSYTGTSRVIRDHSEGTAERYCFIFLLEKSAELPDRNMRRLE
jgi:hypothetical protein